MNLVGSLFFVSCFVAVFCQQVKKFDKINQPLVCIKKEETLALTLIQGADGSPGYPGRKGELGEHGLFGFPGSLGINGVEGPPGFPGLDGEPGSKGERGDNGLPGPPGSQGSPGPKGETGNPGKPGITGSRGPPGEAGNDGENGDPGPDGLPRFQEVKDLLIHALNDYEVIENGYYNNIYHVTPRELTDGRTDTGGWGSKKAKTGNFIQANYLRPVYVTSVTVAGGFIPSWNHEVRQGYGKMKLEYSKDGTNWKTSANFSSPVMQEMIVIRVSPAVTAQYWRLISSEDKWVGTTEFALKPLM